MNRNEFSADLLEKVMGITEKKTREQEKLQAFVKKELEKLGVNSPGELSAAKRKDLFNKVDKAFTSDGEADGTDLEPEDKIDEGKTISIDDAMKMVDKFLEKGQFNPKESPVFRKMQSDFAKKNKLNPQQKKLLSVLMKNINTSGGLVLKEAKQRVFRNIDTKEAAKILKLKKGDKIKVDDGRAGKVVNNDKKRRALTIDFGGRQGVESFEWDELVLEATDPETGLDAAEERFFRVEVLNGATGNGAVFMVGATNHRGAEQQALFAARDEPDLRNPPNIGGFQLVVDSSSEISQEEFEAGEVPEPVGPKTGRNIANESLDEGVDPIIKQVGDVVKGKKLLSIRGDLEKIFKKRDVDFVTSPIPAYMIKHKGKILVITNKKNVDDADLIVGDMAIGFL